MRPLIHSSIDQNTCTLILNRPEKLNCINYEMLQQLNTHIDSIEANSDVKVVVVRGAGERAFSTGGDLKAFRALENEDIDEWIRFGNQVFNRLEMLCKPTIALIHGFAFGGGLEMALACDLRIATPQAAFSMPELHHGWIPGWGGLTRLRRLLGEARAKELIFLSEVIDAKEAHRIGLINRLVETDQLEHSLREITEKLAQLHPTVFQMAKHVIADGTRQTSGADLDADILATRYSKAMVSGDGL